MADNSLKITIEEITPQVAAKMLEGNRDNRPVAKTRVATYAHDIERGRWRLTGDPIKVNGSDLIDGQHRLLACLMADKPFTTAVARGVSLAAHAAIDTGMTRTLAHELRWQSEKHYAVLASAINLGWQYDNETTGKVVASRADHLAWLAANGSVRESIAACMAMRTKVPGLHATSFCVTHFLITREHTRDLADRFAENVAAGTDYADGDPALALRTYAATVAASRLTRPSGLEWLAVTIKAANAWIEGRPVKTLRWRRVGQSREQFPRLISSEEASL